MCKWSMRNIPLCICYATAFLWRISSRKRPLCLISLPALFIPSSLFCHHILPPPHPTPHKTSSCLLSSFIHPASLPSLGSLSVYCTQKQIALLILTLNVACGGHFTSSAVHFHRPQLMKSLEHDQVEPAHTPEGNTGGREGKHWDFHGALHFCGSLLRQTLSSRAPGRTKSSRSKCSKPFVSSLSHSLPCAETWSYSSFSTTLLVHWSYEMSPLLPWTHSNRCHI